MDYDPVGYHADAIVQMVSSGMPLYKVFSECGISIHGSLAERVRAMLIERGVDRRFCRRNAVARRRGHSYCRSCGIELEPYDPDDPEQASWQNGTTDGLYCTYCAAGSTRLK